MLGAGLYIYETAGLGYAFIPFLIGALLRGDRDKQVAQMLFHRQPWGTVTVAYYLILLLLALVWPRKLSEASGTVLALSLAFPLLAVALWNDVTECTRTKQ